MKKAKWLDFLIILCVMFVADCFPINLITNNPYIIYGVQVGLQVLLLAFIFLYVLLNKKCALKFNQQKRYWVLMLFTLPLFFICGSNFYYAWIFNEPVINNFQGFFPLQVGLNLLVSINEDLIFLDLFEGNLEFKGRLKRILLTSAIFAASHITRFLSSFNPADLVTIVYAFGLCIICGFMFEYGGFEILPIVFHFVFNVINSNLFEAMYQVSNYFNYILVNVIVGVIAAIYLLIMYFLVFEPYRKDKDKLLENKSNQLP